MNRLAIVAEMFIEMFTREMIKFLADHSIDIILITPSTSQATNIIRIDPPTDEGRTAIILQNLLNCTIPFTFLH